MSPGSITRSGGVEGLEGLEDLLEEVFKVVPTAGGPGEVAGVPALHPLPRHDVGPAGAGRVVVVVVHPQAAEGREGRERHLGYGLLSSGLRHRR